MTQLLLASRNAKKLAELRRVVEGAGITGLEVIGLDDVEEFPESPETGATFAENALVKARDGYAETGLICIADDSGLEIDALNDMPGVLSARWCGRHGDDAANTELVLGQLKDVPAERRGAAFVSVCALVGPNFEDVVVRGEWRGRVIDEPRGDGGFGYDPIFVPDDEIATGRTSAELSAAEKDSLSHRGKALAQLVPVLIRIAEVGAS
jgi:XTP/dITP diphosphohydrolase